MLLSYGLQTKKIKAQQQHSNLKKPSIRFIKKTYEISTSQVFLLDFHSLYSLYSRNKLPQGLWRTSVSNLIGRNKRKQKPFTIMFAGAKVRGWKLPDQEITGGDAESRTPVQRRSHISVYSLDDIDLTFVVDIDELAKGEIHYFSSTT